MACIIERKTTMSFLVGIVFFASVAAVFIAPGYFRNRERMALQETLRAAFEKGQPVPPEIIESISAPIRRAPAMPVRDIRIGVVFLSIGLGCYAMACAASYFSDGAFYGLAIAGGLPSCMGAAFILMGIVGLIAQRKRAKAAD
jgi:hypothetical protein